MAIRSNNCNLNVYINSAIKTLANVDDNNNYAIHNNDKNRHKRFSKANSSFLLSNVFKFIFGFEKLFSRTEQQHSIWKVRLSYNEKNNTAPLRARLY